MSGMGQWNDKIALVTGASSVGAATVRALLEAGMKVVGVRDAKKDWSL